jgi:uncharacterized membrane protein
VSATLPPSATSAHRGEDGLSESQERFLRAAAARLPLERVVELHLFPSLRQGGVENGFAVIAARRAPTVAAEDVVAQTELALPEPERAMEPIEEPEATEPENAVEPDAAGAPAPADERFVVFSARYRLTLKGPERGRWEVEVIEEADAPLVTVDAVVRGMQRRIGEGAEPERLTAEQLHALLDGPASATAGG